MSYSDPPKRPAGPGSMDLMASAPIEARGSGAPDAPASTSVWDYIKLLRRRKFTVAAGGLLGALCGLAYVVNQRPVYQAVTTIEVQGINEAFMGMAAVDPQAGSGIYSSNQSNINTQLRIIESASIRMPVVERLQRETTPALPPSTSLLQKLRQKVRRTPMDPLTEMRIGLGTAVGSLHAKSILGTRIIAISCDSTIPDIAANFANTIALEYIAQNTQLRSTSTQKTSQWLESQLEETKVKLEQAEARMQDFVRKSGITFIGEQDTLANSKLKQLQADLAGIQADRIAKQTKYEMIKSSRPEALPDVLDDSNLRSYQSRIADLRSQLAQLTSTYTADYPKAKQIQLQINDLVGSYERERSSVVQRIENDYTAAKRKEGLLVSAYTSQAGAVAGQADKASEYGLLKREVDLYRQTLNVMQQQVNQASVVAAVPANNIRVVDPANRPGWPYKPDATYSLAIAVGLGFVGAFGFVVLREGAAKRKSSLTFGSPGYASSVLFVPEIGVIPSAEFDGDPGSARSPRWQRNRGLGAAGDETTTNPQSYHSALAAWQQKPSIMAESFRLTLTSLTLMNRNGSRPRLLVVTSPGPGEGKTTVASNMGAAMAEAGQRVLLIDMDLRRPQLHRIFRLANERGFTDLAAGSVGVRLGEAQPLICATDIPGLSVLPSGFVDPTKTSELFHSPRVPLLLDELKLSYDTVIVDTPPMLQFSESRLVASFSDGVILVLRSGLTDRDSAVKARDQLARDGVAVLGTILNDWKPKKTDKGLYSSYYGAQARYEQKDAV